MPNQYANALSSGPSVEPVTLFEAKRACDVDDNYRDAEITRWIIEARKMVEHDARIALVNQTHLYYLHAFPSGDRIDLQVVSPLSSVTSITYLDTAGDSQTLATSVYKIDVARRPAAIWLKYNQTWPDTYNEANAVTITYVAGYGSTAADVPETAKQAVLFLVRHRLENPDMFSEARTYDVSETYRALIHRLHPGDYP